MPVRCTSWLGAAATAVAGFDSVLAACTTGAWLRPQEETAIRAHSNPVSASNRIAHPFDLNWLDGPTRQNVYKRFRPSVNSIYVPQGSVRNAIESPSEGILR